MKSVVPSTAVALLLWSAAAATAQTQSLGDLARQEAERRKAIKSSGKVYTNGTLRAEPQAATPANPQPGQTPQGAPATAASPAAEPEADSPAPTASLKPEDDPRNPAYWQRRLTTERAALSRAESFALALQSRINALSTDFVNRDDPAQRIVVGADRDKAVADLAKVNQEIQQHQKAIAGIQESGRRAGVPAGWVR